LQEAGEPLRLRFVQAALGPYAENLRHVLSDIEGHLISGYEDGGDRPNKQLAIIPGAVPDAEAFLRDHPDTRNRFDRVVDLVQGFETPFGLELLVTVHWVATREGAATPEDAVMRTYAWAERKKQFADWQIRLALEVLSKKGWVSSDQSSSKVLTGT
jgi:hypothetical protein